MQYCFHVLFMILFILRVDDQVVHKCCHEIIKKVHSQGIIDESLERGGSVSESERYHIVLVCSITGPEGCEI